MSPGAAVRPFGQTNVLKVGRIDDDYLASRLVRVDHERTVHGHSAALGAAIGVWKDLQTQFGNRLSALALHATSLSARCACQ